VALNTHTWFSCACTLAVDAESLATVLIIHFCPISRSMMIQKVLNKMTDLSDPNSYSHSMAVELVERAAARRYVSICTSLLHSPPLPWSHCVASVLLRIVRSAALDVG